MSYREAIGHANLLVGSSEAPAKIPRMNASQPHSIDLSIIIVSYNTKLATAKCLQSIFDMQTSLALEVIVVDNDSPDGSADYLEEHFPDAKILRSRANAGFSRANNLGFGAAQGRHILCLNPDTLITAPAIEGAITHLSSDKATGMVGVRLIDGSGCEEISAMRFLTPHHFMMLALLPKSIVNRMPVFGDTRYGSKSPNSNFHCDAVVGCFMLFPRWVLDKIGGLDDRFFMYGEEVEWCWRIRNAGYDVSYLGEQSIVHFDGLSTKSLSRWKLQAMAKGQILAQGLMRGTWAAKLTNFWMIVGQLIRLPFLVLLALSGRSEPLADNWAKLAFLTKSISQPLNYLYMNERK